MVDDAEFMKRRHLSRGRPRKYEPNSPNKGQSEINHVAPAVPEEDNSQSPPPPNSTQSTSVASVSITSSAGVTSSRPDVCPPMLTSAQIGSNSNLGSLPNPGAGLSNQAALMAAAAAQFKSNLAGNGPQ